MALCEYRCEWCGQERLAFESEISQKLPRMRCHGCFSGYHLWFRMPPTVSVVLATTGLMLDEPQLDSLLTIYELDRQLNLEARDQIEMEVYQQARRNA